MTNNLIPIEFHGDTIFAIEQPDGIYIVAKPIAERFGLAWHGQLERLKTDPVLSEGIQTICIPSPGGMQETTCLRLDLLNGWLFKIDSRRVKSEARDALIAYQRECYAVLFRHFQPTAAEGVVTDLIPSRFADGLTVMERVSLVREARLAHGRVAAQRMWAMVDLPDVTGRPGLNGVVADPRDGRDCLTYLLGLDVGGRAVSDWIADGQDGPALNRVGLRVREDGLFLSHQTPVFAGSRWSGMRHRAALLTVDGVFAPPNALRLDHRAQRGLLVPLSAIVGGLHDVR